MYIYFLTTTSCLQNNTRHFVIIIIIIIIISIPIVVALAMRLPSVPNVMRSHPTDYACDLWPTFTPCKGCEGVLP